MIGGQKQSVILEMLWLAYHNPEIDQRTGEIKLMRCPEEYGKKWRPKQQKPGLQEQKKEEKQEKEKKKQEEKELKKKKERKKKENQRRKEQQR